MTPEPPARPPLDAGRLAATDYAPSGAGLPGVTIEVVEELASTNALVSERARAGAAEGLVVVAEHQTAGRGRLDRTWETPARSALTFSLLLRPTAPASTWPWLPLLAGYAVHKALRAAGFETSLKWPNDVLLERPGEDVPGKVGGILVERVDTPSGPAAVVGVGLNVDMTAEELPVPEATSLALTGAEPGAEVPDRTGLLLALVASLWESYAAWQEGGDLAGMRLADSYAGACATIGSRVRVQLPSGQAVAGMATGIDASGRLLVDQPAPGGGIDSLAVSAGDVVHVRPEE